MKIRIPKQIKIATHTYKVRLNSREAIAGGSAGLTKHIYEEIILDNLVPPSQLNQIFLHEVLHMIERYFVVKLEDNDIDRIAEGLAMFLFDNLGIEFVWDDIEKGEQ